MKSRGLGRQEGATWSLAYLVIVLLGLCLAPGSLSAIEQDPTPALNGNWLVSFTWGGQVITVQFVAQPGGQGTLVALDPVSNLPISSPPGTATWSLTGQSSQIYLFSISGRIELPTSGGVQLSGTLELTASAPLSLPVISLAGWGQFHPENEGARGSEDPTFDFTAAQTFSLQILYPNSGGKVIRGHDVTIQWAVQDAVPLASQQILLSVDNGVTFNVIAANIDPDSRSYTWTVSEALPRSKKALIRVESH